MARIGRPPLAPGLVKCVPFSGRLTEADFARLCKLAECRDMTVSACVTQLIENCLAESSTGEDLT